VVSVTGINTITQFFQCFTPKKTGVFWCGGGGGLWPQPAPKAIHLHALKLWWKGLKLKRRPGGLDGFLIMEMPAPVPLLKGFPDRDNPSRPA
jgi:hypothetical protein